jgi:hypothetical protein
MRDPHVKSLFYRLETDKNTTYSNPPPITYEAEDFSVELKNKRLKVTLKRHFPTVEEARYEIEKFLRAWELDVALKRGPGEFQLKYENSEVIDRNSSQKGHSNTVAVSAHAKVTATIKAEIGVARGRYPEPPKYFRASPDVETLWQRFHGYQNGNEPLLSMAYFCLTVVERLGGGRRQSATLLRISIDVLNKLGKITSTRGDGFTARKAARNTPLTPVSDAERAWVESAIKIIIRRVAEIEQHDSLPIIDLGDLPTL